MRLDPTDSAPHYFLRLVDNKSDMEAMRVLRSAEEAVAAYASLRPVSSLQLLALYDSRLDAILTSPAFFSLPISEQLNCGFGVFDTAIVHDSHIYQLDLHLERLLRSASLAHITAPLGLDRMRAKVEEVLEVVRQDCRVRLFLSPGLAEGECTQTEGVFYALAYNDAGQSKPAVVREVTVAVPAKPAFLSIIKSNNYMSNALCVLEARAKGGYMGVQLSPQGYILESAVANICAVLKDGRLLTPPADQVLAGTTIRRILELAEALVQEGVLSSAGRGLFTADEAKEGQELMLVGGDGIVGISHLDDAAIGSGALGPVTKRLKALLDQDKVSQ